MQQYAYLIKSAAVVLLPLIPAVVIFRAFPQSTADGAGPLGGIKWKLSGAFAGYVLVVLLLLAAMKLNTDLPNSEVWTVRGKVVTGKQLFSQNLLTIRTQPQDLDVAPDGSFEIKIIGLRKGEQLRFPRLIFDMRIACFAAQTVAVDANPKVKPNNDAQEFVIDTPIELERVQSGPDGAPCPG